MRDRRALSRLPFFQSQLGSIGASIAFQASSALPLFQSQLGSIGARPCGTVYVQTVVAFNPSLVRLAPFARRRQYCASFFLSIPAWFDWRSPCPSPNCCCPILSIPAWFDWRRGDYAHPEHVSHLSIPAWFDWRSCAMSIKAPGSALSIPAWFDWRSRPRPHNWRNHKLSIPAWFDWRMYADIINDFAYNLSIPAWFDWRQLGIEPDDFDAITFNPSLVRLAHRACLQEGVAWASFQSQLGSIGAPRWCPPSARSI